MQIKIDCDKRLKERGGTEYEGGWYYNQGGHRFATYSDAKIAALSEGHEVDNAGWRYKMLMWNWHSHSLDGYPGWEIENQDETDKSQRHPAFIKLTHKRGKGDVESSKLCSEWDDIAEVDFYQRDWTDDGIPFVREGDTYWSGWWFQTMAERDRFLQWYEERKK